MVATCPTCHVPFPTDQSMALHHTKSHPDDWDERFWHNVVTDGDGCLEWTGPINPYGYAEFTVFGDTMMAHRLTYRIEHGVTPERLTHTCDDKSCVNPAHVERV